VHLHFHCLSLPLARERLSERLRAAVVSAEQLVHDRRAGLQNRPQLVAVHQLRDGRSAVADQLGNLLDRYASIGEQRHKRVTQFAGCPVARIEAGDQAQRTTKVTPDIGRVHCRLALVLDAEVRAPEQVRRHFMTHTLLHEWVRSRRVTPSPELHGLARRAGVLAA
jgi:hypothetical protein